MYKFNLQYFHDLHTSMSSYQHHIGTILSSHHLPPRNQHETGSPPITLGHIPAGLRPIPWWFKSQWKSANLGPSDWWVNPLTIQWRWPVVFMLFFLSFFAAWPEERLKLQCIGHKSQSLVPLSPQLLGKHIICQLWHAQYHRLDAP